MFCDKSKKTEIYECVCPLCGDRGEAITESLKKPRFYCFECGVEYIYSIMYSVFQNYYELEDYNKILYCSKHQETFQDKCVFCEGEELKEKFRKLKFTNKQKEQLKILVKKIPYYSFVEQLKEKLAEE